MPARRLPLRKTRDILRLLWELGFSARRTARSCQTSHATVLEYRQRAEDAGLNWAQVEAMDAVSLERRLFAPATPLPAQRPLPDWSEIHLELKKPGVTLQLLWEEYKACHPEDGYQYSRFSDLYRTWRGRVDLSMRQQHKAGEKVFVDYCGQTVPINDPATGESFEAQVFVAVLGASNYTYAEATRSQKLPDWIGPHTRALEFFDG